MLLRGGHMLGRGGHLGFRAGQTLIRGGPKERAPSTWRNLISARLIGCAECPEFPATRYCPTAYRLLPPKLRPAARSPALVAVKVRWRHLEFNRATACALINRDA